MAINDVSLTAGMRSNLVSLQSTVNLLNRTQDRLSTGKKVNTALDNPLNYFTAKALNSRADSLAGYKDGMSEAVQTIKAANQGITAIEGLLAQAKAVAATAKAGVEGGSGSYLWTVDLQNGIGNGNTFVAAGTVYTAVATDVQQSISFSGITGGDTITIGGFTYTAVATTTGISAKTQFYIGTTDHDAVAAVNFLATVTANIFTPGGGKVAGVVNSASATRVDLALELSASGPVTDSGTHTDVSRATIATGSTEFLVLSGSTAATAAENLTAKLNGTALKASAVGAEISITSGTTTLTAGSCETNSYFVSTGYQVTADRQSYANQFNDIMTQLNLLATDSGYKGINFLALNNTLDVEFGSPSSDKITLTSFDASAEALLAKADGTKTAQHAWATNVDIDVDIAGLSAATATLKTETSRLSSGLSIINTRQDWVKGMVNTVTEGADNLTLADMNEEGANMLMLQTRQSLGTTALSLSAQAAQSVLKLFS
jgi:flagellin